MAGFWKACLRVLANYLATAHRPTVPPSGERTVIVVARVVALTVHFLRASSSSGPAHGQLSSGFTDGQAEYRPRLILTLPIPDASNIFENRSGKIPAQRVKGGLVLLQRIALYSLNAKASGIVLGFD